jgi:uncharacterized protein (DUF58 family)
MERGLSLTATGRGVLGGSVVLYAVGVVLGYAQLVAIGAGGLVALGLGVVLVARRPRVTINRRVQPDRVVVGGTAQALVVVTNRGRVPSPRFAAVDRVGGGRVPVPVPSLAPGATARLPYVVPAERRGRLRLGPVVVTRLDPLALVRRHQPHAADQHLWVHPRTHLAAPVPTGLDVELEGAPVEGAPRGAVTFSSLREYVPGDDVRQIHWRSTARTGTLMVRDHVDTSQPRTTVALDPRAERWAAASFEEGVEVVASVALAAERAGHPAVLVAMEPETAGAAAAKPFGNGSAASVALGASGGRHDEPTEQPLSVLDRLCLVEPLVEGGARVLDRLELVPPGGALVFVTGAHDGPTLRRVAGLRRRFSLVVLVQVSPGVAPELQRRSGLLVLNAGSGRAAIALWNRTVGR